MARRDGIRCLVGEWMIQYNSAVVFDFLGTFTRILVENPVQSVDLGEHQTHSVPLLLITPIVLSKSYIVYGSS